MGRPKGMLEVMGRPILEYLFDQIAWPGPTTLITAPGREHPPGHKKFDREACDPVAGRGPLRGVLTALEQMQTNLLAVATLDMPAVGKENLHWLVSQLRAENGDLGVMCKRTLRGDEQIEPFPIVLTRAAGAAVREALESGRMSVHGLLARGGFRSVAAPADWNSNVWTNLNRPEDLQVWESGLAGR